MWKSELEKEKDLPCSNSLSQMATLSDGPGWSQDSGISSASPLWVQGPKNLVHISLISQAH